MSIYDDKIDHEALGLITTDFLAPHEKTVWFNDKITSSTQIRDNRLHLPTWSGPYRVTAAVLHEISHIVEIDDKRCHLPDLGLKWGDLKQVILGKEYQEFTTWQASQREIRVFAIQRHLVEHYKPQDKYAKYATLTHYENEVCNTITRFMDDSCFIPRKGRGSFDQKKYPAIKAMLREEYAKHTFESILGEWNRKMAIIRKRQKRGCWKDYYEFGKAA